ncbi:helix-turn-helix domain-containing protein [Halobacterium zhouii]|uniref:helix-turn-helix domain-containing protein n=1 Tax=Halobacterium zhouii TaxID=2902624 RepID=UPI001E5F8E0B|nr:helix-turn-helix domain-containing protein [Halobacterium zhouii]
MSVIAAFSLTSPRMVLYDAMTTNPDVRIDVESVDGLPDGNPVTVMWAEDGDLSAFDAALREDPTVENVARLESFPERNLYKYRVSDRAEVSLYPRWMELGGAELDMEASNGEWTQRVRFPTRAALREFRSICDDHDVTFTLHRMYNDSESANPHPLTDAQQQALSVAFDRGYFRVPREGSLEEIADELGVSQQAASERLRRATHNLAADVVEN